MAKVITLDGTITRSDVLRNELERANLAYRIQRDRRCLDACTDRLERFWKQHRKAKEVCRSDGWDSDKCRRAVLDADDHLAQAFRMSNRRGRKLSMKERYPKGTVFAGRKKK